MTDSIKAIAPYRDLSVTAAAEAQARRQRQRALLEEGRGGPASPTEAPASPHQDNGSYQAIQEAIDRARDQARRQDPQTEEGDQETGQSGEVRRTALSAEVPEGGDAVSRDRTGREQSADPGFADDGNLNAPYATQVLAQEYLGDGLYIPPLQPADEAYRRAGAEPPLISENAASSVMRFAV
jgi:hypothetical protein